MNSAKRVSNQTINSKKEDKDKGVAQSSGNGRVIAIGIAAVFLVFVIVMVCWEKLHPRLIMTVNDEKIYLSDMMTDIYSTEQTGAYLDQIYKQSNGGSYWSAESKDGQTYGEILKENTLNTVMQKQMMYDEAIEAGYTLTDEENTQIESDAEKMYSELTASVKNNTGLNKKKILAYYQKKTLADRYKKDWIDTFDIDDAKVISDAGITPEAYRQYDIQYYYIPYSSTDDNGNEIVMSDDEKAAAIAELQNSYNDISGLEDFSTYIDSSSNGSSEKADANANATPAPTENPGPKAPEGTNIKYTTKSIIANETADEAGFDDELLNSIKAMNNGDITGSVVEDSKGCYIIKMVENNSTEKYDSECSSAISEKEEEVFQEKIEQLEADKYVVEVNDDEWDKVAFGSVTINN